MSERTPEADGATEDQPKDQNPARTFHQTGTCDWFCSFRRTVTEDDGNHEKSS